ncbi:acetyl-CoA carboxylase, carboxyltransferase subunit beta [Salinifilum ghardaiensis]
MTDSAIAPRDPGRSRSAPGEGTGTSWWMCRKCRIPIYEKRMVRHHGVCPECGHHRRLGARDRLDQLLDEGTAVAIEPELGNDDVLDFVDAQPYQDRLDRARRSTGLHDAALAAQGLLAGAPAVVLAMDFDFLGGSLGSAVGEMIAATADVAIEQHCGLIMVAASGGARMQEGALSLMQMAKVSQSLRLLADAGLPAISVITDPTYGGVAASFATLGDVIVAEPEARMGFAGPRVIERTIAEQLPEGFQTAEFLLAHGQIDMIVPRGELKATLGRLLDGLGAATPQRSLTHQRPAAGDGAKLVTDHQELPEADCWEAVRNGRDLDRPTALDLITAIFEQFDELHGDRLSGDCPAMVGGLARFGNRPVMVIGQQKGRTAEELRSRNFGMAVPSGYRKAARLMRLAEKARIPVITLVDTGGAYPGVEAEKAGQAAAIADNLRLMSGLCTPIISVIVSEGGSGGALGIAVADRVLALQNAVYSVISPEGCAAILWRDANAAPQAARALGVGAQHLLRHGVVDGVVLEPTDGASHDHTNMAQRLATVLDTELSRLCERPTSHLLADRYDRFRQFGRPIRNTLSTGDA